MSRIGKQPILLPSGVNINLLDSTLVQVQGPKGTLELSLPEGITFEVSEGQAVTMRKSDDYRAAHGLFRSLLFNCVTGVSKGWQKDLEINGVGMRANLTGEGLNLNLGFSHPVLFTIPEGITVNVNKNIISISGIDKQLVGEIAAQIRKLKKPEPYKGKGIKYTTERIRRKAGKTGKAGK